MREVCGDQNAINADTTSPAIAKTIPSNKMRPSIVLNNLRQTGRVESATPGAGFASSIFTLKI
jgi:hypothetical protein